MAMIGLIMDVSREEFYRAIDDIKVAVAEVGGDVKKQNGRVNKLEVDVSVLKDRGARNTLGAGGAGAGAGILIAMAWEWFKMKL